MIEKTFSAVEISAYIAQAYKDWNIPGGLASVFKGGETILSEGYGVCEAGKHQGMSPDTVFAIGSCTKAFTAAALGLLVDEGKAGWDDPVVKFLPNFAMYDPWVTQHVTLRDLVNHKLGITRWNRLFFNNESFDTDDFISRIRYMEPVKDFRTRFHYGNEQFIVAGKIIEVVSGKSYADFIQERIFDPLEMHSTYINLQQMLAHHPENHAHGHYNQDGGLLPVELRFFDPQTPADYWELGTNAAGSIWSTLNDLKNWTALFLGKGAFKGKQILSPGQVEELTTPQFIMHPQDSVIAELLPLELGIDFQSYAFGWIVMNVNGRKVVVHGGNTVNGNTVIAFVPSEDLSLVTFINTYSGIIHILLTFFVLDIMNGRWRDYSKEGLALAQSWLEGIAPMIQALENGREKDRAPSLSLDAYAGTYESPLLGEVRIVLENGKLAHHYHRGAEMDADLEHWEGDVFRVAYRKRYCEAEFIAFEVDENRCVRSFSLRSLEGKEIQRLARR